jgi:hypothetical protein
MPRKKTERIILQFDIPIAEQMVRDMNKFRDELYKRTWGDFDISSVRGSITVYFKEAELTRTQIDEVLAYWRGDHLPPDPDQEEARRILSGKSTPYRDGTKNLHENIKLIRDDEDE